MLFRSFSGNFLCAVRFLFGNLLFHYFCSHFSPKQNKGTSHLLMHRCLLYPKKQSFWQSLFICENMVFSHGFLWILPRSPRNPSWFLSLSPSSDHTEVILSPNVCSGRVNTVPSGITSWHQFPPVLINYCLKMTLYATKHEIFYDWRQILVGILQKYEWGKAILDAVL